MKNIEKLKKCRTNFVVIVSSMGCGFDKSILYCASNLAWEMDYEIINICLKGISERIKEYDFENDQSLKIAYMLMDKQLNCIDFSKYEDIVFISMDYAVRIVARYIDNNKIDASIIWQATN